MATSRSKRSSGLLHALTARLLLGAWRKEERREKRKTDFPLHHRYTLYWAWSGAPRSVKTTMTVESTFSSRLGYRVWNNLDFRSGLHQVTRSSSSVFYTSSLRTSSFFCAMFFKLQPVDSSEVEIKS